MNEKKVTVENVIFDSMLKMAIFIGSLLGVLCILFLFIGNLRNLKATMNNSISTSAQRVSLAIDGYKNVVRDLGAMSDLSNKNISIQQKEIILDRKCVEYNFSSGRIIGLDGFSDMDEFFRGDRRYFLAASQGDVVISDPLTMKEDGSVVLCIASPVWYEGIVGGKIDSVVFCSIEPPVLDNLLRKFQMSKHSDVYILSKNGTTVAALNDDLVYSFNNNIKNAEVLGKSTQLARIEKELLEGDGSARFYFLGPWLNCYVSAKIEGTPDWKIIIRSPIFDYMGSFIAFFVYLALISLGCWFYAVYKSRQISKKISLPVKKMAERLRMAAEGDYTSEVIDVHQLEEVKVISEATQSLVNRMDAILNGSDRYNDTISIDRLLTFSDFEPLLEYYGKRFRAKLCIKDSQGNILVGEEDLSSITLFREQIRLNDRFVGFLELTPETDCKKTPEAMTADLKIFAKVIALLAASSLRKSVQYKVWRENEDVTVKRFLEMTDSLSGDVHNWIEELDKFKDLDEKKSIRQNIIEFSNQAKTALAVIDDAFEYIKFADLKVGLKEKDYAVSELIDDLSGKVSYQFHSDEAALIEITGEQNMVRRLYGDCDGISKLVIRFISCFVNKSPNRKISVHFDTAKKTYSCNLKIIFGFGNGFFSDEEINKIKEICKKSEENLSSFKENSGLTLSVAAGASERNAELSSIENYVSGFSKIYSVFKMAQLMNCEMSISEKAISNGAEDEKEIKISIEIAQLEGGS